MNVIVYLDTFHRKPAIEFHFDFMQFTLLSTHKLVNVVLSFTFWELHGGTFPNLTVVVGLKFEPVLNWVSTFEHAN
jgi:hypothetical protein